jgi:succinate dehydrogenase hydrophobic anchor subunit
MSDTAARHTHQTTTRRLPRWLTLRNTRLVTGLILFGFVATHLANHALGLVSIDAMEAMREVRVAITRSLPGTALLMLAGIVHAVLGVEKIVSRRLSAISVRGLIQIGFGLLIPVLLARHLIGTRIVHELYGINDNYHYALWAMWPAEAWRQAGLILLVWVHGCIGLYMWIRFRPWYKRWQPLLMSLAVLWPVLAFAGFRSGGTLPWRAAATGPAAQRIAICARVVADGHGAICLARLHRGAAGHQGSADGAGPVQAACVGHLQFR